MRAKVNSLMFEKTSQIYFKNKFILLLVSQIKPKIQQMIPFSQNIRKRK